MERSLARYRIMAYVVGVVLLVLVFVAVPLQFFAHDSALVAIVGPIHGALFIVYLLATLDLGWRRRWPLYQLVLVMAAGTIPVMSFVAERWVVRTTTQASDPALSTPPRS